jgi:alkylation response protein AidB-like acyl-CoA dehydrogenase
MSAVHPAPRKERALSTDTTHPSAPTDQRQNPSELGELYARVAEGAAQRERERESPREVIRLIGDSGLGALRVPVEHGGRGASVRELFETVIALAEADSNVAQSLRSHFVFVEGRIASPDRRERTRWFPEILRGSLFGNGTIERTTKDLFGFQTTLTPNGEGHLLNGTKYYSTGSLYSDWISVMAITPTGTTVAAVVPVEREGVHLDDDWDGMGQRLTASGTTRFEDVAVSEEEILHSPRPEGTPTTRFAFLQLYLVAVMAGIARNVANDAAELARRRTRTFSHASGELPAEDPLIQQVIGRISSSAFAAETVVLAAADALAAAVASGPEGAQDPELCHKASLRAAQAQVIVTELVPRSSEALFDAGGASATSREVNLDRHWRNARTLASHNPAMYKARAIGDLLINDAQLPANGFF